MLFYLRLLVTSSYILIWDFQFSISAEEIWTQIFHSSFLLRDFFFPQLAVISTTWNCYLKDRSLPKTQDKAQLKIFTFEMGTKGWNSLTQWVWWKDTFMHFHAAEKDKSLCCISVCYQNSIRTQVSWYFGNSLIIKLNTSTIFPWPNEQVQFYVLEFSDKFDFQKLRF